MGYTPRALVIGGGVTGIGIARDLAMRGLEVRLVASDHLAGGAGRTRPLLRSGARAALSDPEIAARYNAENGRLREVATHCVEETGGILASLPGDDGIGDTRAACERAGISVERLDGDEMRELEPRLSPEAESGLFVPDATVDPFGLAVANAASVRAYGGTVETHTEVVDVVVEDGAVDGVEVRRHGESGTETVGTDYVVNAAGAGPGPGPGAGRVAAMAGIDLRSRYSTRPVVVADERPTEAVLTRFRHRGQAETVVPFGRRCVLGAGDPPGPDDAGTDRAGAVVSEVSALVPDVGKSRPLRTYRELRPEPRSPSPAGDAVPGVGDVIDHEHRDGLWGLTTVLGGSLTLFRLTAEVATDQVCGKFGIDRDCLTDQHPLPGSDGVPTGVSVAEELGLDSTVASRTTGRLGSRARDVLETGGPNPVVCACESVTRAEVRNAMDTAGGDPTDLDAVRVHTRAGMGECQGGRCCHRLASELHPARELPDVDDALEDVSGSRWAGQRTALWGENLTAAAATYALHATTMNRDTEPSDPDLDAFDAGPVWEDPQEGGGDSR